MKKRNILEVDLALQKLELRMKVAFGSIDKNFQVLDKRLKLIEDIVALQMEKEEEDDA